MIDPHWVAGISPPGSRWIEAQDFPGNYTISGINCMIWMEPRPVYCDRGNWVAKISTHNNAPIEGKGPPLWMDHADGWPRYYFDLERGQREVEAWLKKRNQWIG